MPKGAITLLSGGMDSIVATVMAQRNYKIFLALTFDYGQRAAKCEIQAARTFCLNLSIEHKVVSLKWLGDITRTALVNRETHIPRAGANSLDSDEEARAGLVWVPNRNMVFTSIGASFAEAMDCEAVVAGFNAEEAKGFPDNRVEFVNASNEALKFSTRKKVTIVSPTIDMAKKEIAQKFIESSLDLGSFWCCYEGGERLCGRCESCARTLRAFTQIGALDKITGRFK